MSEQDITKFREPFGPPFYAEDVPQMDALHRVVNDRIYEDWLKSDARAELLKHPRPRDHRFVWCNHEGCEMKVANHAWGKIKAEGWYFSKTPGVCFCPEHQPTWVHKWREQKRGKGSGRR